LEVLVISSVVVLYVYKYNNSVVIRTKSNHCNLEIMHGTIRHRQPFTPIIR